MKLLLTTLLLIFTQVAFAKAKPKSGVDFNSLIKQESQIQNETHKVITAKVKAPSEGSKTDQNKIVFNRGNVHILDMNGKKVKAVNKNQKHRISSTEKLEEDDFSRLNNELNSLR